MFDPIRKTRFQSQTQQGLFDEEFGLRPPLKWAGGKRWLVPRLRSIWSTAPSGTRLVEPFVGGLAVALGLRPARALLNDLSPHLISFYQWLQRGIKIERDAVQICNDRVVYFRNRARFNELIRDGNEKSAEAAMLFYYLNRTCFNGLCRFNASGFFNVPYGRYNTISYRETFEDYVAALSGYRFTQGDFQNLQLRRADFIYADPPYDVEFTSYAAGGFSWADQERLAHWLAAHPGPVVASNQGTKRIISLYWKLGFEILRVPAPRRISCDGNRADAIEMLATKNIA